MATRLAENKLIQLRVAKDLGFRVPRTLVTNDPMQIKTFYEALNGKVIVKPVRGTQIGGALTTLFSKEHLKYPESIRLCPAIYQEYIPGEKHLRVQCFGNNIYAAEIELKEVDWRPNLNVPFRIMALSESLKDRIRKVISALGLKMGILDLKIDTDSTAVWFEVNPQGQFLFIEGITGLKLSKYFATFLYEEAEPYTRNYE